jgi:proteasome component ECM29
VGHRKQATTAAAIECLFASVPGPINDTPSASSASFARALHAVHAAPQAAISHPASLRSLYEGLSSLYGRKKTGASGSSEPTSQGDNDAPSTSAFTITETTAAELHSLLFGTLTAGTIETVRLSRAEALVAISKSNMFARDRNMLSGGSKMSRDAFRESVRALLVGELSVAVKEKLKSVINRLE